MYIFLFGPDSFRAQEKINELKVKFLTEVDQSGTSWARLDGATLSLAELSETLVAKSLFARKRLLIVENVFANKELGAAPLKNFLEKQTALSDNIIIFYEPTITLNSRGQAVRVVEQAADKPLGAADSQVFDYLKANSHVQYFPCLNPAALAEWLTAKLAAQQLKISYQALRLLTALVGGDLWAANNEINKLINYQLARSEKEISVADIKLMVRGQLDEGVFALTDALSNRQQALALRLLRQQLTLGLAPAYLLTMLVRQFRILLLVRQALDNSWPPAQIGSRLKLHPYVLQKSINQARNFNLSGLKNFFSALVRLDYNFKSGKLNLETMLDLLVASC